MALKVLVIDDDLQVCMATVEMLKEMGHTPSWVPDVAKGLKLTESAPFDLVVTDIMMPGKTGYDAILELKAKLPGLKIIAMSGGADDNPHAMLSVASRLGADYALPKPFTLEQLRAAVGEVMGTHQDG